jgi:hypothetical protein
VSLGIDVFIHRLDLISDFCAIKNALGQKGASDVILGDFTLEDEGYNPDEFGINFCSEGGRIYFSLMRSLKLKLRF